MSFPTPPVVPCVDGISYCSHPTCVENASNDTNGSSYSCRDTGGPSPQSYHTTRSPAGYYAEPLPYHPATERRGSNAPPTQRSSHGERRDPPATHYQGRRGSTASSASSTAQTRIRTGNHTAMVYCEIEEMSDDDSAASQPQQNNDFPWTPKGNVRMLTYPCESPDSTSKGNAKGKSSGSQSQSSPRHGIQLTIPKSFEGTSTGFEKPTIIRCPVKPAWDGITSNKEYWAAVKPRIVKSLTDAHPCINAQEESACKKYAETKVSRYYDDTIKPRHIRLIYGRDSCGKEDLHEIFVIDKQSANAFTTATDNDGRSKFVSTLSRYVGGDILNKVAQGVLEKASIKNIEESTRRQLYTRFTKLRERYVPGGSHSANLPDWVSENGYISYDGKGKHRCIFADEETSPPSKIIAYLDENTRDTLQVRIPGPQVDRMEDDYLFIPLRENWQHLSQEETVKEIRQAITMDVNSVYKRTLKNQVARDVVIEDGVREAMRSRRDLLDRYKSQTGLSKS